MACCTIILVGLLTVSNKVYIVSRSDENKDMCAGLSVQYQKQVKSAFLVIGEPFQLTWIAMKEQGRLGRQECSEGYELNSLGRKNHPLLPDVKFDF